LRTGENKGREGHARARVRCGATFRGFVLETPRSGVSVGVVVFVGRDLGAVDMRKVRECLFVLLQFGLKGFGWLL
jgi:hypothetical protein